MRNIKHTRPELVFRDNLRRELARISSVWSENSEIDAPELLKPFVQKQATLNALGNLILAFNDYLDQDRAVYSLIPPEDATEVWSRCRDFANSRMNNPYDRTYSVRDWLKEAVESSANPDPFYKWLFGLVQAA